MTISRNVEKFLLDEIASGLGKKELGQDENLLEQGIIDSLGILKLVTYLEDEYHIRISDEDIVPENFQSISDMVEFIRVKMAGQK
jgi:acyl carrier protein